MHKWYNLIDNKLNLKENQEKFNQKQKNLKKNQTKHWHLKIIQVKLVSQIKKNYNDYGGKGNNEL